MELQQDRCDVDDVAVHFQKIMKYFLAWHVQ